MKTWILIIIGAVIAGLIGWYYVQGLQQVSLEDFKIKGIKEVRLSSFTLTGDLYVNNPSSVSVPVKAITYDIYLKETNQKISSGTLPSFSLEKKMVNIIPFEHTIKWAPSTSLLAGLITREKVFVNVKGNVVLDLPTPYEVPFEKEIDIKEVLKQRNLDKNDLTDL